MAANQKYEQKHTEVRARGAQRFVIRTRPAGGRRRVRRRPRWSDRAAGRALSPPPSTAPRTPARKWNTAAYENIVDTTSIQKSVEN